MAAIAPSPTRSPARSAEPARSGAQRSFDDLGAPLHEVTFCVLDLETTGGSPATCAITELGAVKVRGGEVVGTFQTLVNPGVAIPPEITVLTGITQAMVIPAPRIEEALPAFIEFVGGSVVVGHNVRFDLGFLRAAADRLGYPRLANQVVDTCALARRLVREEVPNCRLGTLAERFRLPHQPDHRALDDAWATTDLLHLLLERAGSMGVVALDDLLALPTIKGHPQQAKLRLTAGLPRQPGVYLFRDRRGEVLYVGKATDLRSRVRSYFSGDDRRKIGQLLRETEQIDHRVCSGPLEAAVLEVRLIHRHEPRYNRQAKGWRRYAYLKLTLDERFPRLAVSRSPKAGDGCLYIGPLPSTRAVRQVIEAVETAVPIRRCTARIPASGRLLRSAPCAPAQLGVATCPCAAAVSEADYAEIVATVVAGLTTDPRPLLDPLAERMAALAAAERYEEAADVRDRADALARALSRQRRLDALRRSGFLEIEVPGGEAARLRDGRLVQAWAAGGPAPLAIEDATAGGSDGGGSPPTTAAAGSSAVPRDLADELVAVASWLDRHATAAKVATCDGELASPLPRLPSFSPGRTGGRER